MEYNERIKAVGIVDKTLGINAKVRIIGLIEDTIRYIEHGEQVELFPPFGQVFGPSFYDEYSAISEGDLIELECERNLQISEYDTSKDKYYVSRNSVTKYSVNFLELDNVEIENYSININKLSLKSGDYEGDFYGYSDNKILGKLRIKNGIISPVIGKHINLWRLSECRTLEYQNKVYLLEDPQEESLIIDTMDDSQLFNWFREKVKRLNLSYVNELDRTTSWRAELPKLFSELDNDRYALEKLRLKRVADNIGNIELLISDIKSLTDNSDVLKTKFTELVNSHKEELKSGYLKDVEEEVEIDAKLLRDKNEIYKEKLSKVRKEIGQQTAKLNIDREKHKAQLTKDNKLIIEEKKENELLLGKLKEEIVTSISELEGILKNKERIVEDFQVIKDVLSIGNTNKSITEVSQQDEDSFVVESLIPTEEESPIMGRTTYLKKLEFQLNKYGIFVNFANKIIDRIAVFKTILVKDIAIGVAIAESTNNCKYIIQQVEADWLHFKDFWNNGLGNMWLSANENPEQMHFLLLEDVNMSSPELYARPLTDIIRGIRKQIPFGKTSFPENLRIIGTLAPVEEPKIGLPIIEQTFKDWGEIGFKGNIYKENEVVVINENGYLSPTILNETFCPDELDINDIQSDVESVLSDVFTEL